MVYSIWQLGLVNVRIYAGEKKTFLKKKGLSS